MVHKRLFILLSGLPLNLSMLLIRLFCTRRGICLHRQTHSSALVSREPLNEKPHRACGLPVLEWKHERLATVQRYSSVCRRIVRTTYTRTFAPSAGERALKAITLSSSLRSGLHNEGSTCLPNLESSTRSDVPIVPLHYNGEARRPRA